jgi:hypothetical protein
MDEQKKARMDAMVSYHADLLAQALKAREHYEKTGELTAASEAPELVAAWQAAAAAVNYAKQLTPKTSALPKRFAWIGVDFLLVFTPHKTVEIATPNPLNSVNLCYGIEGWIDPMKVTRVA